MTNILNTSNNESLVLQLADFITDSTDPTSLRWGWGEGLLCYSLLLLDNVKYRSFAEKYCNYHYEQGITVDCSDRVSPALVSNYLYKLTGNVKYNELTQKAVDYILNSQKIIENVPNHFGTSSDSTYPQSIWVDSLMMFSFFTSEYGVTVDDDTWLQYALNQAEVFAKYLMDESGLWYHSYWVEKATHYPVKKLFWGRGNGWVVLSIPLILRNVKSKYNVDNVISFYRKTVNSVIRCQNKDGSFNTILNRKETYKESSATALICAGIYLACNMGILDKSYLVYADKAYNYCLKQLHTNKNGVFFTKISRPTVPMQRIPYLWYVLMPRKSNYSYGVASLLWAYLFKNDLLK